MIRLDEAGVTIQVPSAGTVHSKVLLHPTSLTLTENRIAIIGANGSGKSTLLRLLNGLVLPTTGRVSVTDLDTRRDGRQVRRLVGFVFTDPLAQLVLATPADDIELSLRQRIPDRRQRRQVAIELLTRQGLGQLADQSVYDLSGGERQLVALTSVLAGRPEILVCDEPTTLLDLRNRDLVRDRLWARPEQLVLATHDLDLAAETDRVLVIDSGRLVADDTPAVAIAAYLQLVRG